MERLSDEHCPICRSTQLMEFNVEETIDIRDGSKVTGRFEYTRCMICKFEFVDNEQSKYNDEQFSSR